MSKTLQIFAVCSLLILITVAIHIKISYLKNENYNFFKKKNPVISKIISKKTYRYFCKIYYAKNHNEFKRNFQEACKVIESLSEKERFNFLLGVLIYCNLDSGNWLIFCSEIQNRKNWFWKKLCEYEETSQLDHLNKSQQKKIHKFIEMYKQDNSYFDVN